MDEEAQVPTPRHEKQKITPRRTGTWHLGKKEVTERCPLLADEEEAVLEAVDADEEEASVWPGVLGCVLWIALGVGAACYFEGWSVVTGLYVVTQIVTTVGYGDVVVSTPAGKIFCSLYVLITVVFIATYVTEFAASVIDDNEAYMKEQLRKVEAKIVGDKKHVETKYEHQNQVLVSFMSFATFVLIGTLFFAHYEACTCSYGVSRVPYCEEHTHEVCVETGGYTKTHADAFYMSLITLTTVGFGDNTPKSKLGRAVGSVWMILGVIACANMAVQLAEVIMYQKKEARRLKKLNRRVFNKLDVDKDGELTRAEFRVYALLKFDMVSRESLHKIDDIFRQIDVNQNGRLSFQEVAKYQETL